MHARACVAHRAINKRCARRPARRYVEPVWQSVRAPALTRSHNLLTTFTPHTRRADCFQPVESYKRAYYDEPPAGLAARLVNKAVGVRAKPAPLATAAVAAASPPQRSAADRRRTRRPCSPCCARAPLPLPQRLDARRATPGRARSVRAARCPLRSGDRAVAT
eukprot:6206488-Pleurochrysis_carterae.AAC.3